MGPSLDPMVTLAPSRDPAPTRAHKWTPIDPCFGPPGPSGSQSPSPLSWTWGVHEFAHFQDGTLVGL